MIILSELLKCWDYMCELSKQAFFLETRSHMYPRLTFNLFFVVQVNLKLMAILLS